MAKKSVTLEKDGFKTVWHFHDRQELYVDVYKDKQLIIEWGYPRLSGSLAINATIWQDQAILQATSELKRKAENG